MASKVSSQVMRCDAMRQYGRDMSTGRELRTMKILSQQKFIIHCNLLSDNRLKIRINTHSFYVERIVSLNIPKSIIYINFYILLSLPGAFTWHFKRGLNKNEVTKYPRNVAVSINPHASSTISHDLCRANNIDNVLVDM